MGLGSTKLEKSLGEEFPEGEHYMGFENVIFIYLKKKLNYLYLIFFKLVWKYLLL